MTTLRVLQFITPNGFYGAERWVIALANNLPGDHLLCDLAVTRESDDQDLSVAEYYPREAGEVHYLPMKGRFDPRVVGQLVELIRRRRIDVIHTHGYKSDILGWLAARRAGIRCVSTPHGYSGKVGWKLAAFIRLGTYLLRHFDAVAPLSEELVDDMRRFRVPDRKVHFIRNGVDLKEIDGLRQQLQLTSPEQQGNHRTLGFIGQLIPRKGLPDLLNAFDRLHARFPELRLQLLGEGRQRDELEALASGLESADAIEFLGFRHDRLERLAGFDLFVMTSSLEGIPRCMMEAMAMEVPVVAYDIPGVDQLVDDEQTGLLAPLGDVDRLVAQCERVLSDASLVATLRRQGRERIDQDYSAARMAWEYERLFLQLLDRSPAQASPGEIR